MPNLQTLWMGQIFFSISCKTIFSFSSNFPIISQQFPMVQWLVPALIALNLLIFSQMLTKTRLVLCNFQIHSLETRRNIGGQLGFVSIIVNLTLGHIMPTIQRCPNQRLNHSSGIIFIPYNFLIELELSISINVLQFSSFTAK